MSWRGRRLSPPTQEPRHINLYRYWELSVPTWGGTNGTSTLRRPVLGFLRYSAKEKKILRALQQVFLIKKRKIWHKPRLLTSWLLNQLPRSKNLMKNFLRLLFRVVPIMKSYWKSKKPWNCLLWYLRKRCKRTVRINSKYGKWLKAFQKLKLRMQPEKCFLPKSPSSDIHRSFRHTGKQLLCHAFFFIY